MSTEIDYLDLPDSEIAQMSAPRPVEQPAVAAPVAGAEGGEGGGNEPPAQPAAESGAAGAVPAAEGGEAGKGGEDGGAGEGGNGGEGGGESGSVLNVPDGQEAGTDPNLPAQPAAATAQPEPKAGAEGAAAAGAEGKPGADAGKELPPTTPAQTVAFASELATALQAGIRANGKLLQIRSADEALKLIQMGAGYTPAMQKLAPVRRIAKMLENNELLDEGKITFLIDLHKKNPAAIQKLLADSNFDPLSVNKAEADSYVSGDHMVSDTEVQFQEALDDLIQTPEGTKLLQEIQTEWDQASKRALFQKPELVSFLNLQRSNGIYEQITSEMDRLRVLGQIPVGTPFLQAYEAIGDMLNAQGKLVPQGAKPETTAAPPAAAVPGQAPAPAAPKVSGAPPAAAKAAAPVRNLPTKPAPATPNYLDMPDAEFLKQSQPR